MDVPLFVPDDDDSLSDCGASPTSSAGLPELSLVDINNRFISTNKNILNIRPENNLRAHETVKCGAVNGHAAPNLM